MKKLIASLTMLTLIVQGVAVSAFSSLAVDLCREINSISAENIVNVENIDCYEAWDIYSNGYETEHYTRYFDNPIITVHYTENSYREAFTGTIEEAHAFFGAWPNVISDQSYNNQWTVGNTYTCTVEFEGAVAEYTVEIVPSPIDNVEVSDIPVYTENSNGYIDYYCDSDTGECDYTKSYYHYNIYAPNFTVYFKDGTDPVEGDLWSVIDALHNMDIEAYVWNEQSFDTPWVADGDNTVYYNIGGFIGSYSVTITANPLLSIEYTGEALEFMEYVNGSICVDIEYDDNGNSHESPEYFRYWGPEAIDVPVKAIFSDGSKYEGDLATLCESLEVECYADSTQSCENPWGVGEHRFTFDVLGHCFDIPCTITDNGIASISASVDDVLIYENFSCFEDFEIGENGEEITYTRYYYDTPLFTVSFDDGRVETGNEWEFFEKYGFECMFFDEQSAETPWGIGTHNVRWFFMGFSGDYDVTLASTGIKNITVEKIEVYENIDFEIVTNYVYDEGADDYVEVTYPRYDSYPRKVTVEYLEGGSFSGDVWMLEQEYAAGFMVNDGQTHANLWEAGTHTVTASFLGIETEYEVEVLPCPVKEVSFMKAPDKTEYISFEAPNGQGAIIKVEYTDGESAEYELTSHFNTGCQVVYDEHLDRNLEIYPGLYYDEDTKTNYLTATVCDISALCPIKATYAKASSLSISNKDGYLYITSDITGKSNTEKVLDIRNASLSDLDYDENGIYFTFSATVVTETLDIQGSISLAYPMGGDLRQCTDFKMTLFGIESNTLSSCPWFNAYQYYSAVSNCVAAIDYEGMIDVIPLENGKASSANIDFLIRTALEIGAVYGLTEDLPSFQMTNMGDACLISAEDLETLLYRVFSLENEDLDSIIAKSDYDTANSRYSIPMTNEGSTIFADTPFSVTAVKNGNGWDYEISTVLSSYHDTGLGITISVKFDTDLNISDILIERSPAFIGVYLGNFESTVNVGDSLDLSTLELYVEYSDGYSELIPITSDMISGFDSSKAQVCTVTVTYKGYTDTFTVNVEEEPEYTVGDVNADGNVNMKDILVLRKIVAGIQSADSTQEKSGDLDGNGSINMRDILLLRKAVAGIK